MTIFNKFVEAQKASEEINLLRKKLRVKPEFKFSKSHHDIRDAFFEKVMRFDFRVRALVVNKDYIYSPHLRERKESFYNFFIRNLMQHDNQLLSDAIIKVDGSGNREFQRAMASGPPHEDLF